MHVAVALMLALAAVLLTAGYEESGLWQLIRNQTEDHFSRSCESPGAGRPSHGGAAGPVIAYRLAIAVT